jgi:DNA-binding response OmpR family regulator
MRKKLLIVEDNTDLLELLRLGLKDAGYLVITAANGVEAIQLARNVQPDLILLDVLLPELDGFEVCESLRKDPVTAPIPVIMLTGLTGEFTRYAGLESGADEYVTKPARLEQLLPRIEHWLSHPPRQKPSATATASEPSPDSSLENAGKTA